MLSKESGTTVSAVAPRHQTFKQKQLYNQPEWLSSILAPLQRKFQLEQIKGLLGETLLALQGPTVTDYDRTTLLLSFDRLLRQYVDVKYKGVHCG